MMENTWIGKAPFHQLLTLSIDNMQQELISQTYDPQNVVQSPKVPTGTISILKVVETVHITHNNLPLS